MSLTHVECAPLFASVWTAASFVPECATVEPGFFSSDAGYDSDDIAAIHSLTVGERWVSPDYGNAHQVIRLS